MTVTEEDVVRIARLARLELEAGEKALFQGQLGRILEYVDQLEAAEAGPAPASAAAQGLLREDAPAASGAAEALLANAPAAEGAYFKVPKVLALVALLALAGAAPAAARKGAVRGKADPEGLALMRRGIQSYMEGRFDEGVDVLTKSLSRNPTWKTASGFRAICLWTTGDVEGARRDAKVAMAMKPVDAESHAARGFAHFVSRQLSAAAADFVSSARLNKKYAPAYFGMGSVLSSQERLPEALTNLNLALQLDPKAVTANIVRGTVHEKLRDFRKAVSDYDRVLKLAPDFHWARHYRGRSYREIKEYKKAIEDFTAFLKSNPDNEQALYLRSNAYFLTGKYPEAIADLSRVVTLNPKNGLAFANRGLAYAETGEKDNALSDLRRAKQLSPAKADKIQAQIDWVASSKSKPDAKKPAEVEITGTPGKDLTDAKPGEVTTGIAAEPDLPGEVPLEPLPAEEAALAKTPPAPEKEKGPTPPAQLPMDIEPSGYDDLLILR